MKRLHLVTLTAFVLSTPVTAAPIDVVRPGDHAMTCAALAAEINSLANTAAQPAPAPKKKFGFLRVLSTAANIVPGVALARSAALVSAASVAQASLTAAGTKQTATSAPLSSSPEAQRRERLTQIFEEKRC